MRIAILVEGKTERAFKPHLRQFLEKHLEGKMPGLDIVPFDGGLPTEKKLKRVVERLLNDKKHPADAVIALTDVYPEYATAEDAKTKMKVWVGAEKRFHVHVALHDFEAWLLPYWEKIQKLTGSNRKSPGKDPEKVNHGNSPAYRLAEVYRIGSKTKSYKKAIDAGTILRGEDLSVAVNACSELKAFINCILKLCGKKDKDLIQ
ncbi:MAG TPA: DUF4276 family protein [Planctomycetaceae bacterium]|nr:DUF4276 family protein [Planctomycetaceae bacterium]